MVKGIPSGSRGAQSVPALCYRERLMSVDNNMTIDLSVLSTLEKERGIALEELFALVENALLLAYMKQPGAIKGSRAEIDR